MFFSNLEHAHRQQSSNWHRNSFFVQIQHNQTPEGSDVQTSDEPVNTTPACGSLGWNLTSLSEMYRWSPRSTTYRFLHSSLKIPRPQNFLIQPTFSGCWTTSWPESWTPWNTSATTTDVRRRRHKPAKKTEELLHREHLTDKDLWFSHGVNQKLKNQQQICCDSSFIHSGSWFWFRLKTLKHFTIWTLCKWTFQACWRQPHHNGVTHVFTSTRS